MISIVQATTADHAIIVDIGKVSVEEAHRGSCSADDLHTYIERHYNTEEIQKELAEERNIYHIIYYKGEPAGFSKVIYDAEHPNIQQKNVTKLDRIYLLSTFFNLKLGHALLTFNIDLAKNNNQSGMWLFTWVGNERAIHFYLKNGFTIIGSHQFQVTDSHYNLNHHMFLNIV